MFVTRKRTCLTQRELTPTERMALVTLWFCAGERMKTAEVAMRLGLSAEGARLILTRLSRVIPLTREGERGRWYLVNE